MNNNSEIRETAIETQNLRKSFGEPFSFKRLLKFPLEIIAHLSGRYKRKEVLKDLSFTVPRGSAVGFLGPNGAGKSTTLKVILNLIKKDAGKCFILGFDTAYKYDEALKSTGALVELPVFYEYMSGYDNLLITSHIFTHITPENINEALKKVGLYEHKSKKVSQYSTGMRQKLYVAKILLMNPEIIILDEPTSGMDPKGQAEMRELLKNLTQNNDTTVLISSHLLYEIEQVCDHVVIIQSGEVVACGRVSELLATEYETYELEIRQDSIKECLARLSVSPYIAGAEEILRGNEPLIFLKIKDKNSSKVLKSIIENGFEVFNFTRVKKSLEEFFLNVTDSAANGDNNDIGPKQ